MPSDSGGEARVEILATPLGSNFNSSWARSVSIRLATPGVILPPNGTPTASFTRSPADASAGDVILFDASASSDADGQIVRYTWNWGDGQTTSGGSSASESSHTYAAAGTYTITLTVRDAVNQTGFGPMGTQPGMEYW